MNSEPITLGSLFDGIGAFPYTASFFGIKTIWASEILPTAVSITKRHFPDMIHLGDITRLDGGKIPAVQVLTLGSPCQSWSISGPRTGFQGKSGLFWEAIRILREMREATHGQFPQVTCFENVPGLLSSGGAGRDYKTVLEAFCETEIPMPPSGRWANSGMVRGNGVDIAWVVKDSQYHYSAQRRKRLFVVVDFTGQRAGKILFDSSCLRGYLAARERKKQNAAAHAEIGAGIQDSSDMNVILMASGQCNAGIHDNAASTLTCHHEAPLICEPQIAPTLTARGDSSPCADRGQNIVAVGVHQNQEGSLTVSPTAYALSTNSNATSRNAPLVAHPAVAGTLCASGAGLSRPAGNANETDLCVAYCLQGNMIGRKEENGPEGAGVNKEVSYTLSAAPYDRHAVAAVDCRNFNERVEVSGTLQAKSGSGYSLNYQNPVRADYVIRRLTPTECERLMTFDDGYTEYGHDGRKLSDSARYSLLGNSIVCNCLAYIMQNIAACLSEDGDQHV